MAELGKGEVMIELEMIIAAAKDVAQKNGAPALAWSSAVVMAAAAECIGRGFTDRETHDMLATALKLSRMMRGLHEGERPH